MPEFRVYYDGGATYDGDPFYAPAFGVLAIIQHSQRHGRELVACADYYVWDGVRWRGVDWIGMIDYLQIPGAKRVLFGRAVDREYFYSVARQAEEDPDFPVRTAFGANEARV